MDLFGPCLFYEGTLIAADLHLGIEDQGIAFRASEHAIDELIGHVDASEAKRLVLAGDVLDDFSLRSLQSRIGITRLLNRLAEQVELVLVQGNHDTMLPTLQLDAPVMRSYARGDLFVIHGDRALTAEEREQADGARFVVIGHEHPVLLLTDGIRTERYKCFVRVPGEPEIWILPSAHPDIVGTPVELRFRSPLVNGPQPDAEIIVAGDPPRSFGKLDALT